MLNLNIPYYFQILRNICFKDVSQKRLHKYAIFKKINVKIIQEQKYSQIVIILSLVDPYCKTKISNIF